jgi:tetratricopeptide (TPR) repeat protein
MVYRKIKVLLTISIFSCFSLSLWAEWQDNYGNIADFFNSIYGIDNNAGLTAFPVLNVPMGGRSEGMGTAFAAVSDDISFIEFNPAGSSMLLKSELAFFHNNWIADTKMESLVFSTRFSDFGLGAGIKWLYTPFTEYNHYGTRVSNGYYSEGVVTLNASYNFIPSYYFSGISLGINLKGAFRIMPDYTDNSDNVIKGSGMSQSAIMGMADIGLLTRFDLFKFYTARERNMSAALVIRNLGPPSLEEPLPTVVNAAISYKPFRPFIISFDFNLPVNMTDFTRSEKPYMSLGLALNVTSFLSMRAGFLYKSGGSRISIGSALELDKIAIDINYTLDLITEWQPLNRISLGVRFDLGDGGRQMAIKVIDELYLLGHEAYARGNIEDARFCWEEVLRLDPKFTPARESLAMLENREALIKRIDDLYSLDF